MIVTCKKHKIRSRLEARLREAGLTGRLLMVTAQGPGILDFQGKQLPFTSRLSGTVGAQYENSLAALGDATWFARADVLFKNGVYANVGNVSKTPDLTRVNLRAGISKGAMYYYFADKDDLFRTVLDAALAQWMEHVGYPFQADDAASFWAACRSIYERSLRFMLADRQWAVNGSVLFVISLIGFVYARRLGR